MSLSLTPTSVPSHNAPKHPHLRRLLLLVALLLISIAFFLLVNVRGDLSFALTLRARKLAGLLLVSASVGASTIVFQTLTNNRILTPSIMGLDALYLLLQMWAILFLGSATYLTIDPRLRFTIEVLLMMALAVFLFGSFYRRFEKSLYRLLLIGMVFGTMCGSLLGFFSQVISPDDYSVYQSVAFASFNTVNRTLLIVAALLLGIVLLVFWKVRYRLDVMGLGRTAAIGLGIDYARHTLWLMMGVAVLVSVTTALVGPVFFFGLLVSALTYRLFPTPFHGVLLPASALISAIILVAGQAFFERILGYSGTLSVAINLIGGLVFTWLILRTRTSSTISAT